MPTFLPIKTEHIDPRGYPKETIKQLQKNKQNLFIYFKNRKNTWKVLARKTIKIIKRRIEITMPKLAAIFREGASWALRGCRLVHFN